ncbi:alpha/beta hydrolase-fold protein [Hymenobacter sp. 5317J-9]|uniref:alpha/beta hydrolase-fold protein n=1 Tax=Hymenobacter sp. 5317J-9 TaxID=2932250 RepID=UPI001FD652E6|nr:alpha/beta hydrolase-fold protein [Hymenobacter sp. 5317J-9]UOQ96114.1 alpha/beta hydrolase-fold protein [Hymenobacter sp. 5317J-9]
MSHLPATGVRIVREVLVSNCLGRDVELTVALPPAAAAAEIYPVLYLNDGQDFERLHLEATLNALYARQAIRPFVLVAPHANELRTQEYGTAAHADFNGRGSLAGAYTRFVLEELLPFAQARFQASANPQEAVMAGFSLGGLSAFDIVWHHPEALARTGVFSGSFWWRQKAVGAGYTPADRIMHGLVRAGQLHPTHRFWLQTGTLDERNDRNENGVIDSVEDCLDLIEALIAKGLNAQQALRYVQLEGGHHHQHTWGSIMPDFLLWAFGQPEATAALPAPLPVVRLQLDPALAPSIVPPDAPVAAAPVPLVLPTEIPAAVQPHSFTIDLNTQPSPAAMSTTRPAEGDFLPYAGNYINLVPDGADPVEALRTQPQQLHAAFAGLSEGQTEQAYAPGKWTLKEMLLHQIDTERIFAYRALRFARGDSQNLPGFEQDDYVAHSGANARPLASLLAEYDAVRAATLALAESLTEDQLNRRGAANNGPATVRALLFITAGHELHHLNIIRERYLPILRG